MFGIFNKEKEGVKYQLLPKRGISVIGKEMDILIGTMEEDINIPNDEIDSEHSATFIYPDKEQRIEKSIWIWNTTISLTFANGKLALIEINKGNGLYFKEVNLGNMDYKSTIRKLIKLGYKYQPGNDDAHLFPDVNFIMYCPSEQLQTFGVYVDGYYDNNADRYKIKSSKWGKKSIIEYELK